MLSQISKTIKKEGRSREVEAKEKRQEKKRKLKKYNFFRNFMENHGDKVGLG